MFRVRQIIPMLLTLLVAPLPLRASGPALAFTHVTVIQPSDGSEQRNVTVLVVGERVVAVGRHVRLPRDTTIIDGRGRYLIPGLWDMHVHLGSVAGAQAVFPQVLAAGITGLRDMGTPLEDAIAIKKAIRDGSILGPELYVAGPLLNGWLPFKTPLIRNVTTPDEARRAVDELYTSGVDFVKVHDALGAAEYDAIASESSRLGLPFAGHVPPSITAEHAANAGQRSIEHLGGRFYAVMLACSRDEAALTDRMRQVVSAVLEQLRAGKEPDDRAIFSPAFTRPLVETFEASRASQLVALFRRKKTWQCPTVVSLPILTEVIQHADAPKDDREWAEALLRNMYYVIQRVARENDTVLAGTDASLAHPKLHGELERLVQAGLTPAQALRTATTNPARYFGITLDFGAVSRGRIANLVLLEKDPLVDIRNTQTIIGVVIRGHYIPHIQPQSVAR